MEGQYSGSITYLRTGVPKSVLSCGLARFERGSLIYRHKENHVSRPICNLDEYCIKKSVRVIVGQKLIAITSLKESLNAVHIFVSVFVTIQHAFHHFCKCFFAGPSTRGLHFADGGTKDRLLTDLDNSLQAVEYGEENVACVMFAAGLYLLNKCLIEQIWHEFAA